MDPQHVHGGSGSPVAPVTKDSATSLTLSGIRHMCGIDKYMQKNTHTYSINLLKVIIGENNSSKIIITPIIGLLLTLTLINELLKL